IVPDVSVAQKGPLPAGPVSILPATRSTASPSVEVDVDSELTQHRFVEIRDADRGHELVTLIEIISPNCKRTGRDRRAYVAKISEIYDSETNLVEIDLLRDGERVLHNYHVRKATVEIQPPPDYLILVNRAWLRPGGIHFQIFPATVRETLPCFPVPLRKGDP